MSTDDPVELQRLRWRCRRGLLELDIVLGCFVVKDYPTLGEAERVAFDELLDMADTELWDLVTGNKTLTREHQRSVLDLLQKA